MSLKATMDKVLIGAANVYVRRTMAAPIERPRHTQFEMTVAKVLRVNDTVVRFTFSAPELGPFALSGPDEYFGLIMPGDDGRLVMPDPERGNVRAAIQELPEEDRPGLRWYTIREHRPDTGEIDVDIITHGDSGPGSAWALSAVQGDPVGFRSGGALYDPGEAEGAQLLVADETAVPALVAVLDARERQGLGREGLRLHVEVPDASLLEGMGLPEDVTVHERGSAAPGSAVKAGLEAAPEEAADLGYAWLCGESGMVTSLRRHLVAQGVEKRSILFSGYWKLGQARG